MAKALTEHPVRIGYIIVCIIILVASLKIYPKIMEYPTYGDTFQYVGTVATLIGLIITICEVWQNLLMSKSIRDEAKRMLDEVERVQTASAISDCLSLIDDISRYLTHDDYYGALSSFRYFRKTCCKVLPELGVNGDDSKLNLFGDIESILQGAIHSSATAPYSNRQKKVLSNKILKMKQQVEANNPAQRSHNVT